MIANSILIEKLSSQCKQSRPTQASLAACCKEILENFKFDCVFIAQAPSPEEPPAALAFEGKEDIMDACLYRLGVEERVALSKLPLKNYSDITGKPVFNKSGSLRMQKPNSGVFLVHYKAKQNYILLGCGHQEARSYEPNLLGDLSAVWKGWSTSLGEAAQKIIASGKVEAPQTLGSAPVSAPTPPPAAQAPAPVPAPKVELEVISKPPVPAAGSRKEDDHRRPVVLVDEVTRLFNRDYFEESLTIEVERAKRYSRLVSLLFLSVSPVNSGSGKPNENLVATQVAEILSKSLRRVDVICRLDQNKYGIILPDTANNTYGVIAKRVFKYFKQIMGDAPPVFLNISASTYPKHAADARALLDNTEKLLVQAQDVGPNKAVLPE